MANGPGRATSETKRRRVRCPVDERRLAKRERERKKERKKHRDEGKKEEGDDDEENKIKCRTEAFRISSSDLTRKWKKPGTVGERTRDRIKSNALSRVRVKFRCVCSKVRMSTLATYSFRTSWFFEHVGPRKRTYVVSSSIRNFHRRNSNLGDQNSFLSLDDRA